MKNEQRIDSGTQCVWYGEERSLMQGATQVPVVHSVGFGYDDVDEWLAVALGEKEGHIYGRNTNPTVHAFEEKVRLLEGAEAATSASTGMEIAKGCDLVYLESPTNPTTKIVNIARLSKAAKDVGATVVVDNTFATPINQHPLALGADLVLHSATKFLGGHADALGGIICGEQSLIDAIYHYREINGATLHPMAAYLLLRGMNASASRMKMLYKLPAI